MCYNRSDRPAATRKHEIRGRTDSSIDQDLSFAWNIHYPVFFYRDIFRYA